MRILTTQTILINLALTLLICLFTSYIAVKMQGDFIKSGLVFIASSLMLFLVNYAFIYHPLKKQRLRTS